MCTLFLTDIGLLKQKFDRNVFFVSGSKYFIKNVNLVKSEKFELGNPTFTPDITSLLTPNMIAWMWLDL